MPTEEIQVPKAPAPPPPDKAPEVSSSAASTLDTPTEASKDPIVDAPSTAEPEAPSSTSVDIAAKALGEAPAGAAPKAPTPEQVEKVEEAVAKWTGEDWSGAIDDVPEEHRDVAKAVSDFYSQQLEEQSAIAKALEEVIDQTGRDPRLVQALADLERNTAAMEAKQAELSAAIEKATGLEGQLTEAQQARERLFQEQEEMAMREFLYRNPEMADEKSKVRKRAEEILADEESYVKDQLAKGVPESQIKDLWDIWELPDLAKLSKTEFKKVRQLRAEGVPTKYAMELAKGEKKEEDTFPVDALAGGDGPGARPTLVKKPGGGTFQDTLDSVAENTLLRFRKKV